MGALGLHRKEGYRAMQAAAGGIGEREVELFVSGTIESTSQMVRTASTMTGGMIIVLRNPIDAACVRENAAIGALSECIRVGEIIRNCAGDSKEMVKQLHAAVGLEVLTQGTLRDFALSCKNGFVVGGGIIGEGYEVTFWNKYMTADRNGDRLATFPDLIHLLDQNNGLPICSAALKEGMEVILVNIPREKLLLSSTMFDKELLRSCEGIIGKPMIPYLFNA